jgi:flagellar L-ring protein precursor FlgH
MTLRTLLVCLCVSPVAAQNLYAPPTEQVDADDRKAQAAVLADPAADPAANPADAAPRLRQMSLLYVKPPEPREFKVHDLITILVDESSSATSSQSLDTTKEVDHEATINTVIDPWQLLQLRLRSGDTQDLDLIRTGTKHEFKGDGDYKRTDRVSARITARIIDVKPNGTIVLEATKRIEKDEESQTMVLAGTCRSEDITRNNTVNSSQIADLTLSMQHEGEVREASQKGIVTQILDALFAF